MQVGLYEFCENFGNVEVGQFLAKMPGRVINYAYAENPSFWKCERKRSKTLGSKE